MGSFRAHVGLLGLIRSLRSVDILLRSFLNACFVQMRYACVIYLTNVNFLFYIYNKLML